MFVLKNNIFAKIQEKCLICAKIFIIMSDLVLFSKLSNLPQNLKIEVIDYIEFLEKKYQTSKTHPKAGCMKGTFKMYADFDAPLDDFKDYM